MKSNQKKILLSLLILLAIFHPLSLDMYTPAFPLMQKSLGASIDELQLSVSAFIGGLFIFQFIYGIATEHFGRKRTLITGLLIYVFFSFFISLIKTPEYLVYLRVLQAAGAGVGATLSISLVADFFDKNDIAAIRATIATGVSVALFFSPIIGGWIAEYVNWRAIFILQCLLGFLALMLSLSLLKKDKDRLYSFKQLCRFFPEIIANKTYLSFAIPISLQTAGMYSFITVASSIYILHYHVKIIHFGWFYAVAILGYMTGNILLKKLKVRYADISIFKIGITVSIISSFFILLFSLFDFSYSYYGITIAMSFYMLSSGLVFPSGTSIAIQKYLNVTGIASSVLVSMKMLIAMLITGILGFIGSKNPEIFGVSIFMISLLSWVSHSFFRKL
mgnify:CR=1 FL=1|tara:strand:+ start:2883 stop:4052 length:1170 start_codon:yes stop_codon:yes gene_type:complete